MRQSISTKHARLAKTPHFVFLRLPRGNALEHFPLEQLCRVGEKSPRFTVFQYTSERTLQV